MAKQESWLGSLASAVAVQRCLASKDGTAYGMDFTYDQVPTCTNVQSLEASTLREAAATRSCDYRAGVEFPHIASLKFAFPQQVRFLPYWSGSSKLRGSATRASHRFNMEPQTLQSQQID